MRRTIELTESVYARLASHAKGFDTPTEVIERLLDHFEHSKAFGTIGDQVSREPIATGPKDPWIHLPEKKAQTEADETAAALTNAEIQLRVSRVLAEMPMEVVDQFCDREFSKRVFGINHPLLVKIPIHADSQTRLMAVKDKGVNRWTWKFSFQKGNFTYAICTQWFRWNDELVKRWLKENEQSTKK